VTVDRLSALDASFVWFEHPGTPVHVGAVATFEAAPLLDEGGRLRLDVIRRRIAARIGDMPRLRRRLVHVPFDLDRPRWVDDAAFDIAHHIRAVEAPSPGDDAALRRIAGALMSEPLPRDRPLWELRFVTGLAGDRVGLVQRVHHSMVDGVAGVDLASLLLDTEPEAPAPPAPPAWSPEQPPRAPAVAVAALHDQATGTGRAVRHLARAVRRPAGALHAVRTVAGGLGTIVDEGLLAPRTPLNAVPTGPLRLAWVRAPLADVRAAGRAAGASINDVVLSAVAGGLRSLLLERGDQLPADLVFKALVPVSRRGAGDHDAQGNRVSALYAPLPVGIGDPDARLSAVSAAMRRLKGRPESDGVGVVLDALDALPAVTGRLLARAVAHQRFVNLVVTNVPGPPVPLYTAGAKMLEAFPVVPLAANLAVGVAVLSYDGALTVTLTADTGVCPDVDTFATGIAHALGQLGVTTAPATNRRRRELS
jgi:diacylglycerol O-acyltransferase